MKYKKIIIFALAIIAVGAAVYGVWNWQNQIANQPTRQDQDIR